MQIDNFFETPIQRINESINNNNIYIKRDDLFPFSFGGNKARKATNFFKDFAEKNADCIVTYGSSSSNHCRIVANICASKKIPCYIISPHETSNTTTNSILIKLLGAKIVICPLNEVKETIDKTIENLRGNCMNPYFIEGGGHGNLGTEAYITVYEEIRSYELKNNIHFDYIFLTSGTGTTQAGLICGKILNKEDRSIIGISNARKNPYGSEVILKSVNDYLVSIQHNLAENKEVCFVDDYILGGYGDYNHSILETIKLMLKNEGIPLDKTYTGKSFWGMKQYIKKYEIKNKNILFIHTGGTPLFFDNLEEF